MAQYLAVSGPTAAGVNTFGARLALLWVCLTVTASGVINDSLTFSPLVFIVAQGLLIMATLLLTSPQDAPLPVHIQYIFITCALSAAALSLVTEPAIAPNLWTYKAASYCLALSVARGNLRTGTGTMTVLLVLGVVWAVVIRDDPDLLAIVLLNPVLGLTFGFIWHFVIQALSAQERAHRSVQGIQMMEFQAADQAATNFRTELGEIRAEALPGLNMIRGGQDLTPDRWLFVSVTEGSIRDRIRSPRLGAPALRQTIALARERGVKVLVLAEDNDTPTLGPQALPRYAP